MSDYQPKPGDRVTSPLLVGEWTVLHESDDNAGYWWLGTDFATVCVWHETPTPVAPPLPTEPAVGSVVRAHGRLWTRDELWWRTHDRDAQKWPHLATAPDLSPVVPVDDVADWLDGSWASKTLGDEFRASFGGWDQ